jgi:hypothetical protein
MQAAGFASLQALFQACVDYDPKQRPGFESILHSMAALIQQAELAPL